MSLDKVEETPQLNDPDFLFRFGIIVAVILLLCFSDNCADCVDDVVLLSPKDIERPWSS